MPAVMTHYLFGEKALPAVGDILGLDMARPDLREAYFVGCQGPDPLFFKVTGIRAPSVRAVGTQMHRCRMSAALAALRDSIAYLHGSSRAIGMAFCAGQLAHYLLDRTAHPLVYAQEYGLCSSPDLADAHHEVHALIESDIDAAMLQLMHHTTVSTLGPLDATRMSERARLVAGILVTHMGRRVYGRDVRPVDFGHALSTMRLCYRLIEPAGSRDAHRMGTIERVFRKHSELEALAHRIDLGVRTPSMNPDHAPWMNPFTGERSCASFPDLFDHAVDEFVTWLPAYASGVGTLETARAITRGIDYSGRQLDADEAPAPGRARRHLRGAGSSGAAASRR